MHPHSLFFFVWLMMMESFRLTSPVVALLLHPSLCVFDDDVVFSSPICSLLADNWSFAAPARVDRRVVSHAVADTCFDVLLLLLLLLLLMLL
jgi:hypothetical protein